jgi:very-short-patch-repair endonuclease
MRIVDAAAPIAAQQLGLVTRSQLVERGVSRGAVDRAARDGRLIRIERCVFLVAGAPATAAVRLLAKVLSAGEGAVASHRSAAWLWGLVDDVPGAHEVTVSRGRRPRTTGLIVHEARDLGLVVPGNRGGVPVTDLGRTLLDCAGDPGVNVQLLVDAARRHHHISRTLLPNVVTSHARRGRPGLQRLRRVVADDEMPHSDFERLVARWLGANDIDGWELHHRIVLPHFGPVELDLAWPDRRVAWELEGADHRDRAAVHDRDTRRQNALALAGWHVFRLTYRRWVRQPEGVLGELRSALDVADRRQDPNADLATPGMR